MSKLDEGNLPTLPLFIHEKPKLDDAAKLHEVMSTDQVRAEWRWEREREGGERSYL
jgi:hypothetical protein